jgi:hypothetical protein
MIQAFLAIQILETGNIFQEYGNDYFLKGVEIYIPWNGVDVAYRPWS